MKFTKVILSMAMMLLTVGAFAKTEKVWVQGSVGKLSVVVQTPDDLAEGQKCPIVIMMHGFMGNKDGMMEKMAADNLASHGIATVKFDFNGHGESDGEFSGMTVPNEIEDAKCIYEYVKSLPFAGDVALTGHSQGGVVASMAAGDLGCENVKCVVLLAPAAVLRDDAIRGSTMGARYNPLDPPELIPLFGDKKLGGEYIRTAFNLPIYETARKYTGPACIIHGTGDQVVPYTYGERYHYIWPGSELHILPAADHMFSKDMQKVVDLMVDFLVKTL
jgi:pimeloyl-ACP methyl ester carboxylesterase